MTADFCHILKSAQRIYIYIYIPSFHLRITHHILFVLNSERRALTFFVTNTFQSQRRISHPTMSHHEENLLREKIPDVNSFWKV